MEKDKIVFEIENVLKQIEAGKDINACKCSYYPVRGMLEMALRWEIGEKFRLLNTAESNFRKNLIEELADLLLKK